MSKPPLRDRLQAAIERFSALAMASSVGRATAADLPLLDQAIREARDILAAAAPAELTASQTTGLRNGIAETVERRAFVLLTFGRFAEAKESYREAAALFAELDSASRMESCRQQLDSLERLAAMDLDQDVEQAEAELASTPAGSFAHCEVLARSANLYLGVGDSLEARRRLEATLAELASLGIEPPTAQEHREAFARSIAPLHPGAPTQTAAKLWQEARQVDATLSLFAGIYTSLAFAAPPLSGAEASRFADQADDMLDRAIDWGTASRILREGWEREREAEADDLSHLPPLLRPGGMRELIDFDQGLEDGPLKQLLLQTDRELERQNHDSRQRFLAAKRRNDEAYEKSLAQAPIDTGAPRLRLALLMVRRANGGAAAAAKLLPRAEQLEQEARRSEHPPLVAMALRRHAELLVDLDRDEQAVELLEEGVALLTRVEPHQHAVQLLRILAEIRARRADWPAVAADCERGVAIVEKYRYKVTPPYLQLGYLGTSLALYVLGSRAAYQRGESASALTFADLSKGRSVLTYAPTSLGNGSGEATAEREFAVLSREIDARIAAGVSASPLLAKRRPVWERLFIERAHRERNAGRGVPATVRDLLPHVQRRLAADEAVLYYYWLDRETLLVAAIDRSRLHLAARTLSPQLLQDLAACTFPRHAHATADRRMGFIDAAERDEVERGVATTDAAGPQLAAALARLSGVLLPDLPWLEEKQRLVLSPHRMLHAVPFPALTWRGARLVRRFATSHVPNLGSLLLEREPAPAPRILAIGSATSRLLAPPLGLVEREVDEIAAIYRGAGVACTALCGAEATKARWLATAADPGLASFSCLHFATHGSDVAEDAPMESRLYLRDAAIDGVEISTWRLQAELVVLSACWSAKRPRAARGFSDVPGDDVLGLQGAFFAAGARRVLGTLWPVFDKVAYEVMVGFHRECGMHPDRPPEIALQRCLIAYLDAHPERADRCDWAPFILAVLGRAAADRP